jgi:hypothetical protein
MANDVDIPGTKPASQGERSRKNLWVPISGIAGVVVAIAAIISLPFTLHIWPNSSSKYGIFITPPNGAIPRCATITGHATIPSGDSLWLAQHGVSDQAYYSFEKVDIGAGGSWHATLNVGNAKDINRNFTVFAFALDDEASEVLTNTLTSPAGSFFYLKDLPQQITQQASRGMARGVSGTTACQ